MNYTQHLRGLNCLKWLVILEGALYVLIVVVAASNGVFTAIRGHHVTPDQSQFCPLPALFAVSGFVASGIASALARSLSSDNEAHIPVVWTFPLSRAAYALSVFATDGATILAAFALTFAWIFALIATFGVAQLVIVTPDAPAQLIRYLAMPLALYGFITAVTASTGKGGRALTGWTWVGLIVLGIFAASDIFPQPWHAIFVALNVLNPLAYVAYHYTAAGGTVNVAAGVPVPSYLTLNVWMDVAALVAIGVAGLVAGTLEWRRLEA